MIKTGLDNFIEKDYKRFQKMRLGVVCNQASVNSQLRHISELLLNKKLKLNISCFFGPQHGIRGEKQDNMIESDDFIDPITKLPIYSLYGETREPQAKTLENIDAFLIDLQDIGTRIYTFMYTMANCMNAAKQYGKKVIVLDRPNPINALSCEGNLLKTEFKSFVGFYPISVRHGMTMGELAELFNDAFAIGCDLEVIKMKGYSRKTYGNQWGRDWVAPSPNIPNLESALVFPGIVHFEGTLISEGRGTTKPFEQVGAPFISSDKIAELMNAKKLKGFYFRPVYFQPTYQKGKDQVCGGVQIHITDKDKINAFEMGMHLLSGIYQLYPKDFKWKEPPYEYIDDKPPIDVISGTEDVRLMTEGKIRLQDFLDKSKDDVSKFKKIRSRYLLYKN